MYINNKSNLDIKTYFQHCSSASPSLRHTPTHTTTNSTAAFYTHTHTKNLPSAQKNLLYTQNNKKTK